MGNTVELIKKYLQPIYVETGSSAGDGIQKAMEAGADCLIGIEPVEETHKRASRRFSEERRQGVVSLIHGTSERHMKSIVDSIDVLGKRAIFFLDAHKCGSDAPGSYPLMFELLTISKADRRDHTIMIDDVRLFGIELPDTVRDIMKMLMLINPLYTIGYEDSDTNKKDVLVAYL